MPGRTTGFTLVEMSIVLVIIGLVVGGIIAGRDLIDNARVMSQIHQITKYNAAANAFQLKYNYLPGDIPNRSALAAGLAARGTLCGQGDGNGALEGNGYNLPSKGIGTAQSDGETVMFWVDLSAAGMISESFTTATCCGSHGSSGFTGPTIDLYLPKARLGSGNRVLVMGGNGGTVDPGGIHYMPLPGAGPNYFEIENVSLLGNSFNGSVNADFENSIPVAQAYTLDAKIDDGMPTSGTVLAVRLESQVTWVNYQGPPLDTHVAYSTATCYDNGAVDGVTMNYSMRNGSAPNCGLAFRFK